MVVLKGLPIDVVDKFAHFLIKIDCGFDATNIIREGYREDRSSVTEGNARFVEDGLVEGDIDSLVLSKVLGNQHMLNTFDEELERVGSVQTSRL